MVSDGGQRRSGARLPGKSVRCRRVGYFKSAPIPSYSVSGVSIFCTALYVVHHKIDVESLPQRITKKTKVLQQSLLSRDALARRGLSEIGCFVIFQSILNVRDQIEMGGKPAGVGANLHKCR